MSTYAELYAWLSDQAGITALVGNRIYPVTIPQAAAYPCLRLERNDEGGFKDFDGQGETIATDLQIDCLADGLDDALAIAAAVAAVLKNYTGLLGTRRVVRASLEAEYDDFEPELDQGVFRASQAWTLWHY